MSDQYAPPQYPLVSCLMPTADRREFIPRAIRCFQAQTYPNLELIVVNNGEQSIGDLVWKFAESMEESGDTRPIRSHLILKKLNHGQLMNYACEYARGEYCIVWDDDDYYAPDRVFRQIGALLAARDYSICGLKNLLYYDKAQEKAWRYSDPTNTWLGAIAFRKSAWEAKRFAITDSGADLRFQEQHKGKVIAVHGDAIACAIHDTNAGKVRNSIPTLERRQFMTPVPYEEVVAFTKGDL